MGHHKKEKCSDDALCRYLLRFRGEEITIRTHSGDTITGTLIYVSKYGLVEILEEGMLSPFMEERIALIRCTDIEIVLVERPADS
jgi:hypothetical protein